MVLELVRLVFKEKLRASDLFKLDQMALALMLVLT